MRRGKKARLFSSGSVESEEPVADIGLIEFPSHAIDKEVMNVDEHRESNHEKPGF